MISRGQTDRERNGLRARRVLLIFWCCFIVYGSLIPFRFSADTDFVLSNLAKVQFFPFQAGSKNFSLLDIVSNVLLFIPFGFLLSGSGLDILGRSWLQRVWTTGVLAFVFATLIEAGQLFAAGRRASGIDVESDVLGALLGGVAAYLLQRYKKQVDACMQAARAEHRLVPIGLLMLWLCSDAFYPFAVTLDVSTGWHNLKHARWIPSHETRGFWLDHVVDEAVTFGMLSGLICSVLRRHLSGATTAAVAIAAAVAFSLALEVGKLLVVGRVPTAENVLLASVGAVLGVTAVPMLAVRGPIGRHPKRALAALALSLLVYSELTPFAFAFSSSALAAQMGRIEWMPLLSYSRADAQSALFDFWRKLALSGFWGFSFVWVRNSTPGRAARAGLVVGGALEAAQLFTVSRIPSIGDMLILGLGAWIGATVYHRYRGLFRLAGGEV
jgi:VanZ family protein